MRVDHEPAHPDVDQMIERKRYQRLLKNGNERLGNVIRQRTQAQAQSGPQNECMCDYVHKRSTEIPRRIPNAFRLRLSLEIEVDDLGAQFHLGGNHGCARSQPRFIPRDLNANFIMSSESSHRSRNERKRDHRHRPLRRRRRLPPATSDKVCACRNR